MTGPAYVIEHEYMTLGEKAQTEGLSWRETHQLLWLQDLIREQRALWLITLDMTDQVPA